MKPGKTGLVRILHAARYSWQGLLSSFRNEASFRQELFLALMLVPGAFWLGDNGLEIAVLIASVLLVLIVELLNTSIEAVVDSHGDEWNELSGVAKDTGSAAVLIAMILFVVVWGLIIWENL